MRSLLLFVPLLALCACSTTPIETVTDLIHTTRPAEARRIAEVPSADSGPATMQRAPIFAQSIDQIAEQIACAPCLSDQTTPPQVLVDARYLKVDERMTPHGRSVANRLRVELNRAANGRLFFVSGSFVSIQEMQRKSSAALRLEGMVEPLANAADLRLGRHRMELRLIDRSSNRVVWQGACMFEGNV